MAVPVTITVVDDVGADRPAVEALDRRATTADGRSPLNEAAQLHLRHPRPGIRHLLARRSSEQSPDARRDIVGYAQLESGDAADTAQLVVDPDHRRQGIGRALLDALIAASPRPVQLWAMGDTAAAAALAEAAGLRRVRGLAVMLRPLTAEVPVRPLPDGVTLRTFIPGHDEDAWLALNARAFASHPEQGRITRSDLDERMAEDWFDPAGFLLAERDGRLIGFHWTKRHPDRLGEVYVLGVDPDAGGGGIGATLLFAGLRHLQEQGDTAVQLYVESDHTVALRLYTAAGFVEDHRDVLYGTGGR
ncbi:MAG TPA: mycothiol synthase [Microlunatus sp.]|nr:mycothiol synthase [Microlunatus sp.]